MPFQTLSTKQSEAAEFGITSLAWYYDISSKADRGDILIVHDQKWSYRTTLTTKSNQSHSHTQRCSTKSLHTIKQLYYKLVVGID